MQADTCYSQLGTLSPCTGSKNDVCTWGYQQEGLARPNGLPLPPATLCPGAQPSQTGPWAACPGWIQTKLSHQLPEATSTARRQETWLLISILLLTRCVTWVTCLTSLGFTYPSVMRVSQNSVFCSESFYYKRRWINTWGKCSSDSW